MKINLGSGRLKKEGYVNIDCTQIIDGKGTKTVDIVMDIEKEKLPYEGNLVEEILADNLLEHLGDLRFVLNECHRVIKKDGFIHGNVPVAGSKEDFQDPTHKRHFIKETFSYFTGEAGYDPSKPSHPKYADYGYLAWNMIELKQEGNLIYFKMSPKKQYANT